MRCPAVSRVILAAAVIASLCFPALAQGEPLTLRINDTAGEAGELVAITLRTYASRPVHQGQICFRSQLLEGGAQPFASFIEALVFSTEGDASGGASFDPITQTLMLDLESPTSTINESDGPILVVYMRLSGALSPGDEFELDLDPANTFLLDAGENPIPIDIRSGTLTVEASGAPRELEAEGTEAAPGTIAKLSATTSSIFPLRQGQAGFRFDPNVVEQVLSASIDPRYGSATVGLAHPEPGLAVVSFQSDQGNVNWIPGAFLRLSTRIAGDAQVGTQSTLSIDPQHTFLIDKHGQAVPLLLESDLIEIVPAQELFSDDFESGGLASWTLVQP